MVYHNLKRNGRCAFSVCCMLIATAPVMSQNIGMHTITPLAKLHVELGSSLSNGILFTGTEPAGGTFPSLGEGYRLMYYPGKGVFRAGYVGGNGWDNGQVGSLSFAFGYNPIARGNGSTAIGDGVTAGGTISTAFGNSTITKGYSSFVLGMYNDPLITGADENVETPQTPLLMVGNGNGSGTRNNAMTVFKNGDVLLRNYSTVLLDPGVLVPPVTGPGTRMMWLAEKSAFRLGTVHNDDWNADSIGTWSTGIGYSTKAKGQFSLALGLQTTASGITSTAMGYNTMARGENAISMGSVTTALGDNSTSIGFKTYAGSYGSMAMGRFNDTIVNSSRTDWVSTDPILILGNGTSDGAPHNAMVVYKNGSMVLKNPIPVNSDPGFLPAPITGEGTRMMWLPEKSVFRVGTVNNNDWNADSIGTWSTGIGYNTKAKGPFSLALGVQTIASGITSTSMGYGTIASGENSIAMGSVSRAIGPVSTAMGYDTWASGFGSIARGRESKARGDYSDASGVQSIAKGFASTAVGIYNDSILLTNQTEITPMTPLFIVGNGDGAAPGQRKNAIVVRKDGHVGIGTNTPVTNLDIRGNVSSPSIPGFTSSGIVRIGVSANEGIDIGKMGSPSYAGWIQSGVDGVIQDPLSLQPSGGQVGIGTTDPESSALLELNSTTRGFLPPRMTHVQRTALVAPATGLTIWCTDCGCYGQLQIFNGSFWANMSGSPAVGVGEKGVRDGGGIIFYTLLPGDPGYDPNVTHGLVATVFDEEISGEHWGCYGFDISGAAGTAFGTGNQNTIDIVTAACAGSNAGERCFHLVEGGYDDWYLPSKVEMEVMRANFQWLGGWSAEKYFTSSEIDDEYVWMMDFVTGNSVMEFKYFVDGKVRAIRSF